MTSGGPAGSGNEEARLRTPGEMPAQPAATFDAGRIQGLWGVEGNRDEEDLGPSYIRIRGNSPQASAKSCSVTGEGGGRR